MVTVTLSIVVLNSREEFLQFLDPELCSLTESCVTNGLRTLSLEYKFQDMKKDKELFKIGNKIWIQGDNNLTDCLYVINTKVEQDIFKENHFKLDLEEVLVELTYAPLISHTDITAGNGFYIVTTNGSQMVRIDYNSLDYWFGAFYNIGVVQDCISSYAQYITVTGTITPMALLRQIEEETGNVFVTRYEKDCLNNTIHRYLDFLNPVNVSKNWNLNLEYKFVDTTTMTVICDGNGNYVSDSDPWDDSPYTNSMPADSLTESVMSNSSDTGESAYSSYTDTESTEDYVKEDQEVIDEELDKDYTPIVNLNPTNCVLRITDGTNLLNSDGGIYQDGDTPLQWSSSDAGFEDDTQTAVITIIKNHTKLGISVNDKSFLVTSEGPTDVDEGYVEAILDGSLTPVYIVDDDDDPIDVVIPDNSYFEIYDSVAGKCLYRTCINREIGIVHEEVLDLGFNLENVVHNIDETDTYMSVAPVLELNDTSDSSNGLTRNNLGDLINRWRNLSISKGQTIPMIVQKINVTANSLEAAKASLGSYTEGSGANQSSSYANWWCRPYKPQDNNGAYEFLRATAYWNAPYTKAPGNLYLETDKGFLTEYTTIHRKGDGRDDRGMVTNPKQGTTTSTDEDIFQIYNQVALYLKDHEEPNIDLDIDVANLRNGKYNNYEVWDKVYVKIPDTGELITGRVIETSKEAHDVAKNTIKVSNYKTNTIKTITKNTIINGSNLHFEYPRTGKLTVRLENTDYDSEDPYSIQHPANKLLNFTLNKVDNGSTTFIKNYTKRTDAYGYAKLPLKLDPNDYKIEVSFGGDEEYSDSSNTVKVIVGGVKEVKTANKTSNKQKTTKKTSKKIAKTTYYDKYGRSPDKKKILGIGRISATGDQGSYANFYGEEFENHCVACGNKGTLFWDIFWAGNETSNYGHIRKTGNYEGSSAEGGFFCEKCDADYSCQGRNRSGNGQRLRVTKSRFKSSKADAYKLKKGKYIYNKKKTTNSNKNVTNSKTRKVIGSDVSQKVRSTALSIVGEKTGYSALREIVKWMDKKIWYASYMNFVRSPDTVLSKKHGNCCDQTRLFLQLCDAAGLTEYYKLYYCHVPGHVYAIVESKKTGKRFYVDCASDYHTAWAYVCRGYQHGTPTSRYPKRPF